ncbi:hypothetical protein ILYODFUR_021851 [Ilyodon furcidens]|uniref:Uncharacterized protein n=1 Tax=Ilyodon furcidens TaxID=33524 RepID=A0ABV0VGF3_9TELE
MVTHSLLINAEGVYISCTEVPDIKLIYKTVTFFSHCFVTLISETIQDGSLSADLCNHFSAFFRIKVLNVYFCLRVVPLRDGYIDSGVSSGEKDLEELRGIQVPTERSSSHLIGLLLRNAKKL